MKTAVHYKETIVKELEELIARKIGEIPKDLTIEVDRRLKKLFGIDIT